MKKILLIVTFCISFLYANDLEKVSLQLKWKYQFQFAGFIAAYEKGFYKDVGLDVELKEFNKDLSIIDDVINNKSDFGISDSSLVYDALQKKPVKALMAIFQESPFLLMGLQNGKINSIEDLDHKKISLYEGIDGISIKAMLKTKNIEYKAYPSVFSLDELLSGEIDMMTSYISNEVYTAKEQHLDIITFSPKDYGFQGYGDILFTSKKMLEKNPELVKKFYEASLKGWKYAYSNIDEMVDIIYNKYNSLDKTKKALHYEAVVLKKISGFGINLGELHTEKIKSIALQFNLVKNEHNILSNLDGFIHEVHQNRKVKKIVNIMLGFDKPPFIFGQNSSKGIETDLLQEAFALVNYNVNITQGKKSRQEVILHQNNDIDAVATISQKNDGLFYSDEFTVYENYVITRKKDNIRINSIEDLKDIKFVTWKTAYNDLGERFHKLFNPINGKYKKSYHDTPTQIDDAKMFFSKNVDAIIVDKTIFNWHKLYFQNKEEYSFHKVLNTRKAYPVTFRNKQVRDDFNIGLKILKENGRYDEIIKFYETQDIKELMILTNLLGDISAKYIFNEEDEKLKDVLNQFLLHPEIKGVSLENKQHKTTYLKSIRRSTKLVEADYSSVKNFQSITSKIYYKTAFDLLDLGELTLYYSKNFKTKSGQVIPLFSELLNKDDKLLSELYKKYKLYKEDRLFLTEEEKTYLTYKSVITVHNEESWAPYNYRQNNTSKGFSIEYMNLLASKLDLDIQYIYGYTWSGFLDLIKNEKIDVIANITKSAEREKYINFTSSYITSKKAIFSNLPNINTLSDLNGKTIAIPEHFYTQEYIALHYPKIKIKTYKNTKDSLYAVVNKEADAIIENLAVIRTIMNNNGISLPYVTLKDDMELTSTLHIGVRKSDKILRNILEKAKSLVSDEEFLKLESKWFGTKDKKISLLTKKELNYINKNKVFNVCYHKDQDPWVISEGSNIKGYSTEFLKIITEKSGLKFKMIESKEVTGHFENIKNGKCDISPLIVTEPNSFNFLNATVPYAQDNLVLVTKINEPYLDDLNNMSHKKIAIHSGKKSLKEYIKSIYPNIILVEVDRLDLDRVVNGEFYGYIGASYKMTYKIYPNYVNKIKIMTKIGDKKLNGSFGITVREPILLNVFNKSLGQISELERQKIRNAWIRIEIEKQFDYVLFTKVVFLFLFVFIILSISYIKQKKLKEKIQLLNSSLEQRVKVEVQKNREKDRLMLSQSRLAQMGEIISMIAHQWRQPLNSLSLLNQTVLLKYERGKLNDQTIDFFKIHSKKQIHEMSKTIDDFRDFFKPERVKTEFLLNKMVVDTIALVKPIFIANNINIEFNQKNEYIILGYENELGQAILNILNNAKDILIEKNIDVKKIRIIIEEYAGEIVISIWDNAGGIPIEIIEKIFDPYFSTKVEKNGTGLGLYMTKMIIEEHMQGKVTVSNIENGALFEIALKEIGKDKNDV